MKIRMPLLGVVAGVALVASACGSSSSDAGGASSDSLTIGYSSPVESQPSQQDLIAGLKTGAKSLGWKTDVIDANLSPDAQVSNVQTMLQKKVDAISIWTLDAGAMQGTFAQAAASKTPLIGVNSTGDQIDTTVWWQLNLCKAEDAPFKVAAQQFAKWRPGGKIIVMGGPPVPSIQANVKCFTEAAKAAGLTVLSETDNVKDGSSSASALTSDLLSKYDDVDAFWAYNDASALGISAAVTQAGKKISDGTSDGVIVTGANGDTDAIEAVKQGRLTGTWDPQANATGLAVVKAVQDAKAGKAEKELIVESVFWSAENIDTYKKPGSRGYTLDTIPLVK